MRKRIPFFSALGEVQTYLNIVYIFLAFPLSITYFILLVLGFSFSVGFLVIAVGFFIFVGTLLMVRGFRWLDVQLTRVFLGRAIELKPAEPKEDKFFDFVKKLFTSRSTWKSFIYYLLVKLPLDTIIWSVSLAFLAITFDLLLAPVLYQFSWFNDDVSIWLIEFFGDVYVLPFLGIIWGMISLHVIRGLAWVSREINVVFLSN